MLSIYFAGSAQLAPAGLPGKLTGAVCTFGVNIENTSFSPFGDQDKLPGLLLVVESCVVRPESTQSMCIWPPDRKAIRSPLGDQRGEYASISLSVSACKLEPSVSIIHSELRRRSVVLSIQLRTKTICFPFGLGCGSAANSSSNTSSNCSGFMFVELASAFANAGVTNRSELKTTMNKVRTMGTPFLCELAFIGLQFLYYLIYNIKTL